MRILAIFADFWQLLRFLANLLKHGFLAPNLFVSRFCLILMFFRHFCLLSKKNVFFLVPVVSLDPIEFPLALLGRPWSPLVPLGPPWCPLVSLGFLLCPLVHFGLPWSPLGPLGLPTAFVIQNASRIPPDH